MEEDNRTRLLHCALDLFTAQGYDAVGVQDVADAAGLKKPTLYHYFGSKSGLLQTIVLENFVDFFRDLQVALIYHYDVVTTLNRVAEVYFDFARANRKFYRLQLSMWFAPLQSEAFASVAEVNQNQQQMLEAFFERAALDHGNMKGRHKAYAATFLGMINTYISLGLNGYTDLDPILAKSAVRQFMHGIFS